MCCRIFHFQLILNLVMVQSKSFGNYIQISNPRSTMNLFNRYNFEPLSAPLMATLSLLNAIVLTIALCPDMFLKKIPSGHFQTLMLSGAADAKVYSFGWTAKALTDFLWLVRVETHLPLTISQVLIMVSYDPLTIYGSNLKFYDIFILLGNQSIDGTSMSLKNVNLSTSSDVP